MTMLMRQPAGTKVDLRRVFAGVILIAAVSACGSESAQVVDVYGDNKVQTQSWEEFSAASTVSAADGSAHYIVEGDIPVSSLDELKQYYDEHYSAHAEKLAVRTFNSADDAWSNGDQRALEYCVSSTFPASGAWSRTNVIAAMATATARWKQAANIDFSYNSSRDSDCVSGSSTPNSRFFKVAPQDLSASGAYACAFWPVSRSTCSELDGSTVGVDTSLTPPISAARTLTHELGHVLGMIHEYSRNDAPGGCQFQTARYLTDYDVVSIMQASIGACGGSPTETLSLTDGAGIRVLYGMPPAWIVVLDM